MHWKPSLQGIACDPHPCSAQRGAARELTRRRGVSAMLKEPLLYLARQKGVRQFVISNPATRRVARRFVARERLDEAIAATRALNARHISVSLDHLGETAS